MEMTIPEIEVTYRQAKDKANQLKVLADMNCCTIKQIKDVLIGTGKYVDRGKNGLYPAHYEKTEKAKKEQAEQTVTNATEVAEEQAVTNITDWELAVEVLSRRIAELQEIRDNADRELTEILIALGNLGGIN